MAAFALINSLRIRVTGAARLHARSAVQTLALRPMGSDTKADDVIKARDTQIRADHFAIPEQFPSKSFDGNQDITVDSFYRKRLIYRAKQRGWLEVDLILGSWANINVPTLSAEELEQFEEILKLETVDVYNMITGKQEVPEALQAGVMQSILAYSKAAPIGYASPEGYRQVKKGMSN